jgi:hypothetical protein
MLAAILELAGGTPASPQISGVTEHDRFERRGLTIMLIDLVDLATTSVARRDECGANMFRISVPSGSSLQAACSLKRSMMGAPVPSAHCRPTRGPRLDASAHPVGMAARMAKSNR